MNTNSASIRVPADDNHIPDLPRGFHDGFPANRRFSVHVRETETLSHPEWTQLLQSGCYRHMLPPSQPILSN